MHISIIGAGRIGSALEFLARKNFGAENSATKNSVKNLNTVTTWDIDPTRMPAPDAQSGRTLAECAAPADIIFLCTSVLHLRDAAHSAAAHARPNAIIISPGKGLERGTLKTVDEILREEFPRHATGVVGGPMMAEELVAGKPGVAVVGAADARVVAAVRTAFAPAHESAHNKFAQDESADAQKLFVIAEEDARAVALCGVVKNVYALALGVARALEWDGNMRGWYTSVLIEEMVAVVRALCPDRADAERIARGPAGVGDFILTGFSAHSRNATTGAALVSGAACETKGDGFYAVPAIVELLGGDTARFQTLHALRAIVVDCKDAREVFARVRP